jgi:hypothetical protein
VTLARRMRTALPSALLLAGIGVLAGCGGSSGSAASPSAMETDAHAGSAGAQQSGTPKTVDCPAKATPVDVPSTFTAPLPAGTVVVAVGARSGGRTVVTGVVPKAESGVLTDLQSAYRAAGFTLTEGETEERDAESNFTGNSIVGRWGIRELSDCSPVATRIDVIIQKN